jgi:hypothetical protein
MSSGNNQTLEHIAQRFLGQFPDLHGLARQAAGHVLQRLLGYWLDPDTLYWHEFESAASSSLSYTGWRHRGPPRRSLTLTELVMQRFSPAQQTDADQLSVYGGFYRVDGSHGEYDERNEVRLAPQAVLDMFWQMNFSERYTQLLQTFQAQHSENFCVLARARFLAALERSALTEAERAEVRAASLVVATVPITVQALRRSCAASAQSGWSALSIGGIAARTLFQRTLGTGRRCLYLVDEQDSLRVFDDRHALQAWLSDQAGTSVGREHLIGYFIGGDVLAQSLRPRLRNYFKLLAQARGDIDIAGQAITGDLFVRLREQAMAQLVNNAHELLTSNAELRKANWLAGLQAASLIIAPMAPFGWPVVLTSLGLGVGSLGLHLDRAINGKSAWRTTAWSAVVLDILFILLDAAMMRSGELFAGARQPLRIGAQSELAVSGPDWERYMLPAADELLAYSDRALARQESLMGAVPWADLDVLGTSGEYLDAFSEPYPVYRDEHGYGSAAIAEYTSSPERYNNLWRGLPLEGRRSVSIQRSHDLAHALGQIGVNNQLRLYRAASVLRGTGTSVFREGGVGVGDVLVTTDFTSFTENPYALWEVFNNPQAQVSGKAVFDDHAVMYVLEPGEFAEATPVAPFSRRPDEVESLMLPGRYLQVEKVTAVQGANHRFMEVRLKGLGQVPAGARVYEMRTGEVFDREALARRLGADDDSLMRRFFPIPT